MAAKFDGGPAVRTPGRPAIGERVDVRIAPDALARVDAFAAEAGITRAEAIRSLIDAGLAADDG